MKAMQIVLGTLVVFRIGCTVCFSVQQKPQRKYTGNSRVYKPNTENTGNDATTQTARSVVPQNISLDVLYEDLDMLVINKPSGMTMQFVSGSVESAVVFHLNNNHDNSMASSPAYGSSSWPWNSPKSFEGIVHRIDKETSGILVVAKHPEAAKALHASFQERRVHKTYLAIAIGLPSKSMSMSSTPRTTASVTSTKNKRIIRRKQRQLKAITMEHNKSAQYDPELQCLSREIKKCDRDAEKALELLKYSHLHLSSNLTPNAACFSAAISVCKRAGERKKALETFDAMQKSQWCGVAITPDAKCFRKAINICAKQPPLYEKAIELVKFMDKLDCQQIPLNSYCNCISSAISACGLAGQLESAIELLRLAEDRLRLQSIYSDSENDDKADADSYIDTTRTVDGPLIGCFKAAIRASERCGANHTSLALNDELRSMVEIISEHDDTIITDTQSPLHLDETIVVDAPIGRLKSRQQLMGIVSRSNGGRAAKSLISVLAYTLDETGTNKLSNNLSLNRIIIETGRTHQIRVHFASVLGCPLAGDPMYSNDNDESKLKNQEPLVAGRCMLHAFELTIPHPTTGAMLKISCPPPPDFAKIADTIKKDSLLFAPID